MTDNEDFDETDEAKLHPAWRQAIQDFEAAGFDYGSLVKHEWLEKAFGIKPLSDEKRTSEIETARVLRQRELSILAMFTLFRDALLREHQMDLVPDRGKGYIVSMPKDQTDNAKADGEAEIKKAFKKMIKRMSCVNLTLLTDEERVKNANAMAAAAGLARAFKEQRRLTDINET